MLSLADKGYIYFHIKKDGRQKPVLYHFMCGVVITLVSLIFVHSDKRMGASYAFSVRAQHESDFFFSTSKQQIYHNSFCKAGEKCFDTTYYKGRVVCGYSVMRARFWRGGKGGGH